MRAAALALLFAVKKVVARVVSLHVAQRHALQFVVVCDLPRPSPSAPLHPVLALGFGSDAPDDFGGYKYSRERRAQTGKAPRGEGSGFVDFTNSGRRR